MTDGVTILHAHRRRLAKTINADGTIDPYDEAKTFDLIERPVADLAALASLLRDLQQQIHCCVVRGKAADPKRVKAVRRLLHRDAETGDEPTLIEVPRLWVALDVDGLARPEWIDPSDLLGCAAVAIRALPSAFQRAAYVVQATSGHGLMPGMRIRLWCWLSRPTSTSELKLWLRSAPVDPSVLGGAQIIYTAAPIIAAGAYDPLTRRLDMVPGTDAVPVPEPALLCPARPRKRPSTRSDRKGNIAGLVRTVAHAGDHNRNNALYWAARRIAEDADIDARAAARQLEAAAIEAGLSAKEASATIKSALRHAAANG